MRGLFSAPEVVLFVNRLDQDLRRIRMNYAGALEAGGTKFVCVVGSGPGNILEEIRFPTAEPAGTISRAVEFFGKYKDTIKAIGIGSFGPLDPDRSSPTYGYITSTPKPGWHNVDLAGALRQALELPVAFDTDVNAAAVGESRWGAAQGLKTFLYLTVGTGIGGGALCEGKVLHGLMHPEMGHIMVPHDHGKDPYRGKCPYHGDCLEGLAAGPAIEERWGCKGEELADGHPAWELEAHYLASACAAYISILSPERIILGGGVMEKTAIFPMIREKTRKILNGYIRHEKILGNMDNYIVPPALGKRAGSLGALAMALDLIECKQNTYIQSDE
jgi:fructokinase